MWQPYPEVYFFFNHIKTKISHTELDTNIVK